MSLADLNLPVSRVIIAHNGTANRSTIAACSTEVHSFQTYHMEKRVFWDIDYNFFDRWRR